MSPSSKGTDETVNDALLEKLRNCVSKPQEVDTFRNIAAKIHARVTSTGNPRSCPILSLLLRYISVFRTTILQNFIFPQWKLDGCRIEERTRKNSFANGILKRRMPLVTVSLFILVSETITESRISATKFLTRLETRLDSLRHGLVPVNCYFYRERWLLFHRANHQKLAQFIIRIAWWGRLLFARPPLGQKSAETLHTFPSLRFPNFFSRPLLIAPLLNGSGRKRNFSTFVTKSWSKK